MNRVFPILNLPVVDLSIKENNTKEMVFDNIRKKWLVLTPEEWVRQHFLHFLQIHLLYPPALAAPEKGLTYNRLQKRCDILWYGIHGKPLLLGECKAPSIKITQQVIDQAAVYNKTIQAPVVFISNGLKHFCWITNQEKISFLDKIPTYKEAMELI